MIRVLGQEGSKYNDFRWVMEEQKDAVQRWLEKLLSLEDAAARASNFALAAHYKSRRLAPPFSKGNTVESLQAELDGVLQPESGAAQSFCMICSTAAKAGLHTGRNSRKSVTWTSACIKRN